VSDESSRPAPRVAIRTLGCKVNRTESEALVEELLGSGVELVDEDAADVVVVNTCTVTAEADAKARKAVRHALRAPREPVVVVTGCLAALDAEGLQALGTRVIVESDKTLVADRVRNARVLSEPEGPRARSGTATRAFRTRATVKVQDGCDHRCTYCIVPDARGDPVSVPAAEVVGRVAALHAGGTAEVVLTGVNIGRYSDRARRAGDLAALIEAVAGTGVRRIRVSSIEPMDLTPRLLSTLASNRAIMPHLHVPLQSGCDRTLGAMGRGYDSAAFADAITRARAALPGLAVSTDMIAGFPGETAIDFAASLAFVEACGFCRLHVFRYSPRPGTPAARMEGRVDPREAAERARVMRALGERLAAAHASARVGGRAGVLVERVENDVAEGTSEDYLHVRVRSADGGAYPVRPGEVLDVELTAAERGDAWGRPARC
jgi:threonylcarbamoyladenosine tRNA methylthiotransferase MtaB